MTSMLEQQDKSRQLTSAIDMRYFICFTFLVSHLYSKAQNDTLYVLYQSHTPNYLIEARKHRDDTEARSFFPFDGGRHYHSPKQVGKYKKDIAFIFSSHTPAWMDQQFYYQELDQSQLGEMLKQKGFKDREWFDKTSYVDIIKYFGRKEYGDQIIMLYDETQPPSDKVYLVRVYFSFEAEE